MAAQNLSANLSAPFSTFFHLGLSLNPCQINVIEKNMQIRKHSFNVVKIVIMANMRS